MLFIGKSCLSPSKELIIEKEAQTQRNKNIFRICTKSSILWSKEKAHFKPEMGEELKCN